MGVYSFLREKNYSFEPVFDGSIHRFAVGGRKDKSGWFIGTEIADSNLKNNIKILVVGDWVSGEKHVWSSKKRATAYEKEVIDKELHLMEMKRIDKEMADNELAITKLNYYISFKSSGHESFAYLNKKLIHELYGSYFCKTDDVEFVLIPLRDVNGKVWSAQRIFEDGAKRFISGGKLKGCFHVIGNISDDAVYICEGWATGVTIHKATGKCVICTMNTSNMITVASELKKALNRKYVICSDNDVKTQARIGTNPGIDAATKAASILNCPVITPEFDDDQCTDFNDMENTLGLDEVKKYFTSGTVAIREQQDYPTKADGFFYEIIDKNGNEKQVPDYEGLADYMINEHFLKSDDSLVYLWSGKHYKSISFMHLKHIIDGYLKKGTAFNTVTNFSNKSLVKSFVDFNDIREPFGFLNCSNGVLNVRTGEFLEHSPDRFLKYVLDHDYDSSAECPTFLNSIDLVTNGDDELKKLIQQVFGYCISGGDPIAHKAFMFFGEGGNGKSTILTALSNLVGGSNSARVPLTLFDKPFSMISLDGKLVNLIDETPKFNINPEAFKNVVSGGYVRAAHKGKPEVDLKINARIIFACNKMPNFKDDSDGMLRRLIIIPFNHKIPDIEADRKIDDKIKVEMSGILNWALAGLKDLMASNYMFTEGAATRGAMDEYKVETDSVFYFYEECLEFMDGPSGDEEFVEFTELYTAYKRFCQNDGLYPVSSRMFSRNATKYYKMIYAKNGFVFNENMRQKQGKGKGIRRMRKTRRMPSTDAR